MLPLNKLALQLGLMDEYNEWQTETGASQDYVVVFTPVMKVQVIRATDNTYDAIITTDDPMVERFWDKPKKGGKFRIQVKARDLMALSTAVLKRLVEPNQAAMAKAYEVYQQEVVRSTAANNGLRPFIERHGIKEEDVLWAGVGNHVAGYFQEDPDVAVHVNYTEDDGLYGSIRLKGLTMEELDEMIRAAKIVRTKRWMRSIQQQGTQADQTETLVTSSTPSDVEESSDLATESVMPETTSSLVDD